MAGKDHPIEPERLEPRQPGPGGELQGHLVGEGFEFRGGPPVRRDWLAAEQPGDARFRPVFEVALKDWPGGRETGPPVQVRHAGEVPGGFHVRLVGCPGPCRVIEERRYVQGKSLVKW